MAMKGFDLSLIPQLMAKIEDVTSLHTSTPPWLLPEQILVSMNLTIIPKITYMFQYTVPGLTQNLVTSQTG